MRILVTGATGFIGTSLVAGLQHRGHQLIAGIHRSGATQLPAGVESMAIDFMCDTDERAWVPRLTGVDVVINAVGILREVRGASLTELHHLAPQALFRACETAGVQRVVQISALGADGQAVSRYHLSKKAADDALRACTLDWTIVQPSVVFGSGGASTDLFLRLASMPCIPLVGNGEQRMQPIHIDDLAALVIQIVEQPRGIRQTVAAVGPTPVTMREMLTAYREALHLKRTCAIKTPLPLMRFVAKLGDLFKTDALSTETLNMLMRGNTASPQAITSLLGCAPRPLHEFIAPQHAAALRLRAQWMWLRPLLLMGIAAMWISAGVVSWIYARDTGLSLLGKLGLSSNAAEATFMAACGLNIALGLATPLKPGHGLWLLQLSVIAFYTAALTFVAPGLWVDPFGPLTKNLPIAALLVALAVTEASQ